MFLSLIQGRPSYVMLVASCSPCSTRMRKEGFYPKQEGMMYTRSLLVHLSVLFPSLVPPYSLDLVILFRHPFSILFSKMITHFAKYGNRLGDARAALHDKVGKAEKSERIDEKKVFLVSDSSLDRNTWPQSRVGPQVMSECLKRGMLKGG